MAAELDGDDLHYGVHVAGCTLGRGARVLVVDAPGATDLEMDGPRVARPLRCVMLSFQDGRRADGGRVTGRARDVIPELAGAVEPDPFDERLPDVEVLAVHEHPEPRACAGWPPGRRADTYGRSAPGAGLRRLIDLDVV